MLFLLSIISSAVNDTYGHSAGDAAFKALTQSIQTLIAAEAASRMTFARVGGDEFTILFRAMEPEAVFAAYG
ncbi:diguanylate cyclase [Rhizobium leguminosarum]|nr:diguanylate cyclase [Rhizobium leguminosarum]MBY5801846.1 diguanylate cyclase [Rhizobium leguminosarum]